MKAVLLDALGTLLRLEPPAPALRRELAARGVDVDAAAAERAMAAEIAYYRAHNLEGGDRSRLADLRHRCAHVLAQALPEPVEPDVAHASLLAALRFTAWEEAPAALESLRAAGLRLVVVSNWDVSLHDRLAETGLAARVDGAIASAELGVAKPGRAIFERALALAGSRAAEALHVGDSLREDVEGARAAGIEPVLLCREDRAERAVANGVRRIRSLAALPGLVNASP